MIKNVVFDFGQVLIHFEPEYMVGEYVKDEKDAELLEQVIFDRLYWDRLDAGTIKDEEVIEAICERIPERLHESAKEIYLNWIYNIPEISGMRELIKYIKERYGVSVYLLSNISEYFAEHCDEIPILKEIDGCVFSSTCGFLKPNKEIFEHLCDKFNIKAEETLFVDDNEDNVKGAEKVGIKTYQFKKDADELKKWLESKLVLSADDN